MLLLVLLPLLTSQGAVALACVHRMRGDAHLTESKTWSVKPWSVPSLDLLAVVPIVAVAVAVCLFPEH